MVRNNNQTSISNKLAFTMTAFVSIIAALQSTIQSTETKKRVTTSSGKTWYCRKNSLGGGCAAAPSHSPQ